MIEIGCPSCGRWYEFEEDVAGSAANCRACGQPIGFPANKSSELSNPTPRVTLQPQLVDAVPRNRPAVRREPLLTRRRILVWGGVGLLGLIVLVLAVPMFRMIVVGLFRGEPFHAGRPISYWISLLEHSDSQARNNGVTALREMGPRAESAVPVLLKKFADPDYAVRLNVAWALAYIAPDDPAVVTAFSERLADDSTIFETVLALNYIWHMDGAGEESDAPSAPLLNDLVPAFRLLLQRTDWPYVRSRVAELLGLCCEHCPRVKEAIPDLVEAVRDGEPRVASRSIYNKLAEASARLAMRSDQRSRRPRELLLSDADGVLPEGQIAYSVRHSATLALGQIGPDAVGPIMAAPVRNGDRDYGLALAVARSFAEDGSLKNRSRLRPK